MKKVIFAMSLLAAGVIAGAHELYQYVPQPVATAVIADKPEKEIGGGQVATLVPKNLTEKQSIMLNAVYSLAKAEGLSPELAQSVLLQETNAGGLKVYKVANPGKDPYFGPMQIKLGATRDVLSRHPEMYSKYEFHTKTDDEVKANLILNERFNMEVGVKYLKLLQTVYGFKGRALMEAYNKGPGGVVEGAEEYASAAEMKLAAFKGRK